MINISDLLIYFPDRSKNTTQTPMLIRQREALNRYGTATHEKGMARLISILDAARELFMEAGYGGFTMRKVAGRAGITIGNLNYYYRTKEDLLRDLLEYVINDYLEEFDRRRQIAGHSPEKQLLAVLKFWIDDLNTAETTSFFPELWALGNHDPYIADLLDDLYAKARLPLNELIPQINPTLTRKEAERMALFMCAAMEGLTVFVGNDKSWANQLEEIKRITIRNFLDMIKNTKGKRKQDTQTEPDQKAGPTN